MGRTACARDHDLESLLAGRLGELEQPVRRAVGGDDERFVSDAKRLERIGSMLHGRPIGLASHDDCDRLPCHLVLWPKKGSLQLSGWASGKQGGAAPRF